MIKVSVLCLEVFETVYATNLKDTVLFLPTIIVTDRYFFAVLPFANKCITNSGVASRTRKQECDLIYLFVVDWVRTYERKYLNDFYNNINSS